MSAQFYYPLQRGLAHALFSILTFLILVHPTLSSPITVSSIQTALADAVQSPGLLVRVRESDNTPIVTVIAVLPLLLSMMEHLSLSHGLRLPNWTITRVSICFFVLSKAIALPLGLLTVLFGVVISALDVSLVGVASLSLVYAGSFGSWGAERRLYPFSEWSVGSQTGRAKQLRFGRRKKTGTDGLLSTFGSTSLARTKRTLQPPCLGLIRSSLFCSAPNFRC